MPYIQNWQMTLFPYVSVVSWIFRSLHFHVWLCHFPSVSLSEICAGCTAWAAVRAGVPVPEGRGRTHLRVWGCYNGRGCSQERPADHQARGQHEPGGSRLVHQQASGTTDGSGVVHRWSCSANTRVCSSFPRGNVWQENLTSISSEDTWQSTD